MPENCWLRVLHALSLTLIISSGVVGKYISCKCAVTNMSRNRLLCEDIKSTYLVFICLHFLLFLFYWRNFQFLNGSIQAFMTLHSSLPSLKLKTSFTETQIFFPQLEFYSGVLFSFHSFWLPNELLPSWLKAQNIDALFCVFLCLRLSHCAA